MLRLSRVAGPLCDRTVCLPVDLGMFGYIPDCSLFWCRMTSSFWSLIYVVVEREFGRMILKPLSPSPLLLGCGEFGLIRGAPRLPTAIWSRRWCSHILVFAASPTCVLLLVIALFTVGLLEFQVFRFDVPRTELWCSFLLFHKLSPHTVKCV